MTIGKPLEGIRVIELAHIMAGPVCGLMLADLGADVIKVERLPNGDGTRGFLPPSQGGEAAAYMMLNRGKRGMAVDLRRHEGPEIVRQLIRSADVLIENFRVGTMERIGLGYDALRTDNEGLVFCQITGFGRTGPLAERGGFDLIAQGFSGLMSVTGEGPGRAPVKVGAPITDITAGILAALGVVSALFLRERTGQGQRVDTSLFEAGITHTYWQSAIALATGISPGPMGSAHPLAAPYQTFATGDGWINVGASNPATWLRLTEAVGAPELRDDPRFRTNADRMTNVDELIGLLAPHFLERTTDGWLERLHDAGVPAGPVASVGEMLEHPQTRARQMVIEVEHSRLGAVRSLGSPIKFSGGDAGSGRADRGGGEERDTRKSGGAGTAANADAPARGAPVLGEHSREILLESGFSDAEIDRWMASGVIQ